jgi:GTP cyclohydrolase I
MLVEKNIIVYSTEHHLLPIGRAHVGYISNGRVIDFKMNRIENYAKRPQVQERLTMQIVQELQSTRH